MGSVKACPVYGGRVKSYDFERIRSEPGVIFAIELPNPNPASIRDRVFSGVVAVIAETWYQAKSALDKMPIEWDVPPAHAARNTANMRAELLAALEKPGHIRTNLGDCDRVFAGGGRIVEATYSTPYLPRARMEPGNATVLVTDNRVDIWIGDQSPPDRDQVKLAPVEALDQVLDTRDRRCFGGRERGHKVPVDTHRPDRDRRLARAPRPGRV